MRTIQEINKELSDLEEILNQTIKRINFLRNDLDDLKVVNENENKKNYIDFHLVKEKSKLIKFSSHSIKRLDRESTELYLTLLLITTRIDEENEFEKLVFIQWILNNSTISFSLSQLYINSFKNNDELFLKLKRNINESKGIQPIHLIVDLMILANLSTNKNNELLNYIADLSAVMGLSIDVVITYSKVVKLIVSDINYNNISTKKLLKELKQYILSVEHYFNNNIFSILNDRQVVFKQRYNTSKIFDFRWNISTGERISSSKIIAYYKLTDAIGRVSNEKVKSNKAGYITKLALNNYRYAVVSDIKEDTAPIIQWIKDNKL